MEKLQIQKMSDVRSFFYFLMVEMELGSFHPDTPIQDYVNAESGKDTFDAAHAAQLQSKLNACHQFCFKNYTDIYKIGIQLAQRLGFFPRSDDNEAIAKAIEEVKAHIVGDKHIIFRDKPFPKGHLTSVEKPHCYLMECGNFVEVYVK